MAAFFRLVGAAASVHRVATTNDGATDLFPSCVGHMLSTQVGVFGHHMLFQPVNSEPGSAVAVSVTFVSVEYGSEQSPGQSMPAGPT